MFRNKEIRRFAVWYVITALVLCGAGLAVHPAAGALAGFSAVVYAAAFLLFTRARYESIARVSDQIDLVLHSEDRIYISEAEEGELSILQSEITKMTLRIREQNAALKREKEYLADSLADVAHQLRTPLTSAALILSLTEKNTDEAQRRNRIREMEQLFVQMDWLITSLLKLSRLDAGIIEFQKQEIFVTKLIHAALRPLQIPLEIHNTDLKVQVPDQAQITGDFLWLSEAVQNILKNCMENAGENGRIAVVCEDNFLFTEIRIHDSGAGFAEEDLPRLFHRFYQGKNSSTAGFGIGLALSRMIITSQGGTVEAENHPKGGALFTIRFSK